MTDNAPTAPTKPGRALVVLSGGQDSTTCLFWAKRRFGSVRAISMHYGQRHSMELEAATKVAELAEVPLDIIDLGSDILTSTSPLVDHGKDVGRYESVAALPGGLEDTFVPARNLLFLTIAANRAYAWDCCNIVTGVCEEDFGGYPDCRQSFITLASDTISEGVYGGPYRFCIHTPLMHLSKADSVNLAHSLGEDCMKALAYSHTCYEGKYPPGPHNHASLLRAKGFAAAGIDDPLISRAKGEGLLPADYPDTGLVEGTPYANWEPGTSTPPAAAAGEDVATDD